MTLNLKIIKTIPLDSYPFIYVMANNWIINITNSKKIYLGFTSVVSSVCSTKIKWYCYNFNKIVNNYTYYMKIYKNDSLNESNINCCETISNLLFTVL
jgi:hypothetical protein